MTKWILTILGLATSVAVAGDIAIRVHRSRPLDDKTITLTTRPKSVYYLRWNGVDKAEGGHNEIVAYLTNDQIVVIEKMFNANGGIVTDTASKIVIPTNKIPYILSVGETTVTVLRIDAKIDE